MADFLTDLWNGVFEPGPNSSLLIATNVAFAALQVVLFALLIATYSYHFVILSFLCGGLWLAINWFANELRAVQAAEQQDGSEAAKSDALGGSSTEQAGKSAAIASGRPTIWNDARSRTSKPSEKQVDSDWEQVDQ